MYTKNQIVQACRKFFVATTILILLFSTLGIQTSPARAQGPVTDTPTAEPVDTATPDATQILGETPMAANITLVPGTVEINERMKTLVAAALGDSKNLFPNTNYFAVTDMHRVKNWAFLSVIGLANVNADLSWSIDEGAWFGLVFLKQGQDSSWIKADVQGSPAFSNMLSEIPDTVLDKKAKQDLDPLSATAGTLSNYIFPWQSGTSMQYGSAGVHDNGNFNGNTSGWKAVDFLSDGNTGAGHAPNRLLAASGGSIGYTCKDANNVMILIGGFSYTHLVDNSNLYIGKSFNQGDELGQLKTGSFGTQGVGCGWASQGSNWFHVHWGFPNADLQVGNWTLSMSTQNWTNGSTTVSPGNGWISSGSSGPSGYTFCASEGGYCSFSGTADVAYGANGSFYYKYGITNGINCDNNTFGDPLSGTPKACYYKLTTPPSCNPTADQVAFFVDANYSGTCVVKGIGNYPDSGSMGIPNDSLSSIRVGSNVKLALYVDSNYGGTSEPLTSDDSNLSDNTIGNDRASSAKVESRQTCPIVSGFVRLFDGVNCSSSYVDAPLGLSQLEQSNFNFNDMAESIAVSSGWSARLYLHNSESSPSACFSSTDTNLGDNTFSDGTNVANQATWIRVYANTSCTQVDPPVAPVPNTPANGQVFIEGESITLSWSATGNEYYGEVSGGPAGTTPFGWQTGTSNIIGPQWAGYVYSWHVKARNSYGESNWSATWTFFIRPGAPTNLSASVGSCSQVNLSWSDNSGNEDGYKVYRNGNLIASLGSNVTSYQDTGLTASTVYSYTVKAYRGSIESNPSNTATATTTMCATAPNTPTNFRVSGSTQTSITVAWDDVSNETGYKIYEWNGTSFVYLASVGTNVTSYTHIRSDCGWDQFYEVSAYNSNGESAHASWVHGYTQPCPFNKSTPANGALNQALSLTLSWASSTAATSYEYCYDTTNDNACSNWTSNGTSTNVALNGLSASTPYYWQVRAINSGGTTYANGSNAAFWSFTTQNNTVSCPATINNWKGEYWTNPSLTGTSTVCSDDTDVNFDWALGSPDPLIPSDSFSARWTRTTYFAAGTYRFYLGHDDGARLFIDDMSTPVLDVWPSCCVVDTIDRALTQGNHVIKVEYFENSGAANAHLWWELINTNTGMLNPSSNLARAGGDYNGYEVNPANAYADDGLFAVDNNSGTGTSTSCTDKKKDNHLFYNYGMSLPSTAVIQGIEVRLDAKVDSTSGAPKICVQLSWDGGSSWTTARSTGTLTTGEQTFTLGGPTDSWGRSWTSSQLSNTNFRVRVIDVASNTSRDFSLDWISVRVTYK
jgi:fibronectin type 3 domain-containing protein